MGKQDTGMDFPDLFFRIHIGMILYDINKAFRALSPVKRLLLKR